MESLVLQMWKDTPEMMTSQVIYLLLNFYGNKHAILWFFHWCSYCFIPHVNIWKHQEITARIIKKILSAEIKFGMRDIQIADRKGVQSALSSMLASLISRQQ